ncbi:MAG: hypothetical protein N2319_10075 [Candidatus Kapabacteria bacterium]|nr:hypothetical protein [Candidatus Kapabacteria bacterium]
MKNILNIKFIFIVSLIILAVISRLIGFIPNFSPIAAIALFGAAYFPNKRDAFIVPIIAMFISDLFIGLHPTMWAVYLSFALTVLIGFNLRKKQTVVRIITSSLLSSVLFFIVTNFAHFLFYFPHTLQGLTQCYIDAIPFFRNTVLGDLVYCGVLFGSYNLAAIKIKELKLQSI